MTPVRTIFADHWFAFALALLGVLAVDTFPFLLGPVVYCELCLGLSLYLNRRPPAPKGSQALPSAPRQPRRSKAGGRFLQAAAPAVAALLLAKLIMDTRSVQWACLGAGFLLVAAILFWGLGRTLCAPDAREVLRRDPRPPVVFLRSFHQDERKTHSKPQGPVAGGLSTVDHLFTAHREQEMAGALNRIGPFIAVGRPGEPLATLGASRVYLADEDWKTVVEEMVRRSAAVVLQPEFTSGTLWEADLVVRTVDLQRLLLVVPDPTLRPYRYEKVRGLVEETFSVPLPPAESCASCEAFFFGPGLTPVPIRLGSGKDLAPFVDHILDMAVRGSTP